MNKKFLSLVLALVMVLGAFGPVLAAEGEEAEAKTPEQKIQWLQDNEIVVGRKVNANPEDNDLALDETITRAEITKLLVFAIKQDKTADTVKGWVKPFPDVGTDHWANGYVFVGTTGTAKNNQPMINGYPDNTFRPEGNVTYAELAKMLVVLKKADLTEAQYKNARWYTDWMIWAQELGILDGLKNVDPDAAAVRKDAFVMVYNAMYKLETGSQESMLDDIGIISGLEGDKLVLNQGDYKKTFKVEDTTNVVTELYKPSGAKNSNQEDTYTIGSLKASTDYEDWFIGSLVRVIVKDEVATHIVVLGNPVDLAFNQAEDDKVKKVQFEEDGTPVYWKGIAEKTVETGKVEPGEQDANGHVEFGLDKTEIKQLKFYNSVVTDDDYAQVSVGTGEEPFVLELSEDTRYFVADANRGHLTEVKDAKAAFDLLGYDHTDNRKIFDVYAGYDRDGKKEDDTYKYNDAKVVVFNIVVDNIVPEGNYRVKVNPTDSNFILKVEDTKGNTSDIDTRDFKGMFPHYTAKKFDVIGLRNNNQGHLGNLEVLIEHEDTDNYPIVKVVEVKEDYTVTLLDKEGNLKLNVPYDRDGVDTFLEDQLKDDAVVQFKLNGAGNEIEIFSVLPNDTELDGDLGDTGVKITDLTAKLVRMYKVGDVDYVELEDIKNGAGDTIVEGPKSYMAAVELTEVTEGEDVKVKLTPVNPNEALYHVTFIDKVTP